MEPLERKVTWRETGAAAEQSEQSKAARPGRARPHGTSLNCTRHARVYPFFVRPTAS